MQFDAQDYSQFIFTKQHNSLGTNIIASKSMLIYILDSECTLIAKSSSEFDYIPKIKFEQEKSTLDIIPSIGFSDSLNHFSK